MRTDTIAAMIAAALMAARGAGNAWVETGCRQGQLGDRWAEECWTGARERP